MRNTRTEFLNRVSEDVHLEFDFNVEVFMRASLIFISASFISVSCFACYIPKKEQRVDVKTLVERSEDIVLAEVKGIRAPEEKFGQFEYTFVVIDAIKGNKSGEFTLKGHELVADDGKIFPQHTEKDFWKASVGRARTNPDCSLSASFQVGRRYLVFPNEPYHVKGFELIESEKDPWLRKVKSLVRK